jgi:hypothetical protein
MNVLARIEDFFLRPASGSPLAALRVGLGVILISQAWMLRTSMEAFFSGTGIIQGELAQAIADPGVPRVSYLVQLLAPLHISELTCIHWVCGAYLAGLVFMVLGIFGRPMIAFCWFVHWMLMNTGQTTNYGVDLYTHAFLFYLIWIPSGFRSRPSTPARLGLRVLQFQLCLSYFFSALEKSKGEQWWNGELLWRALNLPVYQQFDMLWLAQYPWITKIAGWGSLLLELGYIVFIWPKKTRSFWVLAIVGLHLGIAFFLGLTLFGLIMAMLTLTIFGFSAEVNEPLFTISRVQLKSAFN